VKGELDDRVPDDEIEQRDADSAPEAERAPALENIAMTLASLDDRVAQLARVEDRLAESQRLLVRQSELADKLHAENQRLRAGELRGAMLPLVRDLLRLHDDIGRIASEAERAEDLKLMQASLLDALARNGVVVACPETGEQFDTKRHSAAGVVATDDASLDRSIAEVIRLGFQWEDGQAIRVADVRVYKYTPASDATVSGRTGLDSDTSTDATEAAEAAEVADAADGAAVELRPDGAAGPEAGDGTDDVTNAEQA
jgi:molecular chaperone GrpE (heat shock protein)